VPHSVAHRQGRSSATFKPGSDFCLGASGAQVARQKVRQCYSGIATAELPAAASAFIGGDVCSVGCGIEARFDGADVGLDFCAGY
jgi:hypothetical protein